MTINIYRYTTSKVWAETKKRQNHEKHFYPVHRGRSNTKTERVYATACQVGRTGQWNKKKKAMFNRTQCWGRRRRWGDNVVPQSLRHNLSSFSVTRSPTLWQMWEIRSIFVHNNWYRKRHLTRKNHTENNATTIQMYISLKNCHHSETATGARQKCSSTARKQQGITG